MGKLIKKEEERESSSSSGSKRAELDVDDDDDDVLVKMFTNILNTYDNGSENFELMNELMFYYKVCSVCKAWRVTCEKVLASRLLHGEARYDWEELLEDEHDDEEEDEEEEESSDCESDEEED